MRSLLAPVNEGSVVRAYVACQLRAGLGLSMVVNLEKRPGFSRSELAITEEVAQPSRLPLREPE
jgi:hypothetical protein